MLMLADSPTKDFLAQRAPRDSVMSSPFLPRNCTHPRLVPPSSDSSPHDFPTLTPSPLHQRPLFPSTLKSHTNDLFLQSPYKSPVPSLHSQAFSRTQPIMPDDDDGAVFLSSSSPSSSFSPLFAPTSSRPLRTPVKQIHRISSRTPLPPSPLRSPTFLNSSVSSTGARNVSPAVGAGIKRKSTPHLASTPVRHSATLQLSSVTNSATLDRLAPFPAPKLVAATPQTKGDTDAFLRKQTSTLTRLRLTDLNNSPDKFSCLDNDSGCELDDDPGITLFDSGSKVCDPLKLKGRDQEEVAEAISPGGHIIKRRARTRPLSTELLESVRQSPSPSKYKISSTVNRPRHLVTGIVFPSTSHGRRRGSSPSSESDTSVPLPRRRIGVAQEHLTKPNVQAPRGLSRHDNISAASLFFGPSISGPGPHLSPRPNISSFSSTSAPAHFSPIVDQKTISRHSYAGPSANIDGGHIWNTIQSNAPPLSPRSSPPAVTAQSPTDDEEDMFFGSGPSRDSSFLFSVTEGTPPPRTRQPVPSTLPRKYKPRDSGVVLMSDDDDDDSSCLGGDYVSIEVPCSSTNAIFTPNVQDVAGTASGFSPAWSGSAKASDIPPLEHSEVDAFILRTLAAATKGQHNRKKMIPGTPVKKNKTQHLNSVVRPWQSAVAAKVGIRFDWDNKKGKAPRPSLPAAFPAFGKKARKMALDQDSDSEEPEESPGQRREKYSNLGLGRPSAAAQRDGDIKTRTRWLMRRRSSSGAFSSGSESISSSGTPTRLKSKDRPLATPLVPQFSLSTNAFKLPSGRTTSSSSSSSTATLNSPSAPVSRRLPFAVRLSVHHDIPRARRLSSLTPDDQPGRFERDFIADVELGSGEFGKVIKVYRIDNDHEVYAVKKSKPFEGPRHRLRLREEVEVLQHLCHISPRDNQGRRRHQNVLAFIDSWEEDEALYIQTELCEAGNLAQFLWEFGRAYPRLDEDRVWKIIVDLSNGVRFIHDAGVIHLDLKPSNIFITAEGRFKIGDFGMASLWPRSNQLDWTSQGGGFEREGDKLYLAPEVLQGVYSKAADIFSFGMTILETATNIVVPDQGEAWHRLRQEDFSQVDLDGSPELLELIKQMMRTEPSLRMGAHGVYEHPIVNRARAIMERLSLAAKRNGASPFSASPLGSVYPGFLREIVGRRVVDGGAMDVSV